MQRLAAMDAWMGCEVAKRHELVVRALEVANGICVERSCSVQYATPPNATLGRVAVKSTEMGDSKR